MKKRQVLLMLGAGIVLTIAGIVSSCEEKENPKPDPVATSIQIVSGSSQAADVGCVLVNPIEIIVKDQDGEAFKGAKVTFSVAEGSVSSSSVTTDASGKAKVTWTLGSTVGVQTLTIKGFKADGTTGLSGSPLTVKATATEKVASSIELVSGGDQTGDVETALNDPVIFLVKDNNGDPFKDAIVKFAVGEGSLSSESETTDASGKVSVLWTLGATAGTQALTVTAFKADGTTNLAGSPLTVNATALGKVATTISLVSGGSQTADIETTLADSVVVIVKDQNGDAFPGAKINFAVEEGSVSSASATSNNEGKASVSWTLGATAGTQELTVTAFKADGTTPLTGYPLTVGATAIEVLDAYSIELVAGDNQTAPIETTLPAAINVIVKDKNGDGSQDVTVNFSVTEGSVGAENVVTGSTGYSNTSWTLGSTEGIQTLTITAFASDGTTPLIGSPIIVTATAIGVGGSAGDVTDFDGNIYKTVIIGSQIWMAENLKVTHFADGTAIQNITDADSWKNLGDNNTDKAYCFYDFASSSEYGALYTWAAAMNGSDASKTNPSGVQGVCPNGWHMPSIVEWDEMINSLGGRFEAGGPLKETGTDHWKDATGATNTTGFSAFGGGYCYSGVFTALKVKGIWWSTEDVYGTNGYYKQMGSGSNEVSQKFNPKSDGLSVRCVKD